MDKSGGALRDRDRAQAQPARRSAPRGMGKRVTMTDVARLAACSQSTVSVVLNNTPGIRISKETRERVIKVAVQLGYEIVPGHAALSDRPRQIAIVFDRIATSPEAVVSIDGAREMAWTTGHVVTIAQSLNDAEMEPATIEAMLRNGVDALIYATIMTR
jgi:LacI family transcriptional regulator